jgi:hypothetical protein
VPGADGRDLRQRVDGPGAGAAGRGHHGHRALAPPAAGVQLPVQLAGVESAPGQHVQVPPAQAEQLDRLGHAAVRLAARVDGEGRLPGQALFAHVVAGAGLAGRGQRGHRGQRAAADQQPARACRQAGQVGQPADDQPLQVHDGLVAAGAARVHRAGQQIGQHAGAVRRGVHPGVEPRVAVAERMAQHVALQLGEQPVQCHAVGRPVLLPPALGDRHRDRVQHRPAAQPGQVVGGQVGHPVRGGPPW